jgi:ankyrin repeat protein
MDKGGNTPLHIACQKHKESKSTKSIKQLLIKGANRNALNFDGKRPIDYVQQDKEETKPSAQTEEIIRVLRDDGWTFTGDCLVLRTSFRKLDK